MAEDGTVVVPDWTQHRILIYSSSGAFLEGFGSQGSLLGQYNKPTAVACSRGGSNTIFVADTGEPAAQLNGCSPGVRGVWAFGDGCWREGELAVGC